MVTMVELHEDRKTRSGPSIVVIARTTGSTTPRGDCGNIELERLLSDAEACLAVMSQSDDGRAIATSFPRPETITEARMVIDAYAKLQEGTKLAPKNPEPRKSTPSSKSVTTKGIEKTHFEVESPLLGHSNDPEMQLGALDLRAFGILKVVEKKLRNFIEARMAAIYGEEWPKKELSNRYHHKFFVRQSMDVVDGRKNERLVDYMNFPDYEVMIGNEQFWKRAFSSHCRIDRETLFSSLRRLNTIRNAMMHFRSIGENDLRNLQTDCSLVLSSLQS